jgi:hypothetical protein
MLVQFSNLRHKLVHFLPSLTVKMLNVSTTKKYNINLNTRKFRTKNTTRNSFLNQRFPKKGSWNSLIVEDVKS